MLTKTLSVVLLTCALFSGQLLAKQQDHAFVWFATGGHQLRHEADSDELRAAAEESAEGLREHHNWQKSRKPESYFRQLNAPALQQRFHQRFRAH
ncbi:DUF2554 family protein [Salmonella enterica subsp. enterica]|nr:DUF2554 family protein [Salmonella enterica subsp. enterica serovar Typhi]